MIHTGSDEVGMFAGIIGWIWPGVICREK